ncbi:MAG: hypothetical protein GY944_20450, partial [bacterium]|nr:hypothetical protein [bacterium]
ALVDYITLTVCDIDRRDNLRAADAELQTLRIHLELACELELLESDHMIECEDRIHHIGRQIGGWLRSLNSATIPAGSSEC